MLRRNLLKIFGISSVLGAVPASLIASAAKAIATDPLRETAARFAGARKTHPFLAGWQSVAPPGTAKATASIRGKWPTALRGTLFRNGPGLFERGGQRYQHWFDGDGLIQAWNINGNKITHHSKFVQTPKFLRESKSDKFEVMAAGTTIPNARALSGPDDVNTANISVLNLGGKTYALWEAGSAFEIDPNTLETIGPRIWRDDLEGAAFSAHPVFEADGSIWNVGLFGSKLLIYHVGADGELKQAELINLPRGGYMHSFTASQSKLIFVLAPLVRVRDGGSFFESLGWKESLGSMMVVVPKSNLKAPRFAEFESGAAYHYADAWDGSDGSLALRACWYASGSGFVSPFQNYMQGFTKVQENLTPALVEIHLAANAKRAKVVVTAHQHVEFPVLTKHTQKASAIYLQGQANHALGALSGVLSLDAEGNRLGRFDFGDDYILEEQLVAPVGEKRYTIGTILNAKTARTGLVLFDLDRLAEGPLAEAWLERALPLGFHGSFIKA